LAQDAAKPGADPKDIAAKGRQVALNALKTQGPWSQAAAEAALGDSDEAVAEYVCTGWEQAAQQDERVAVQQLAMNGFSEDLATAAQAVAAGGDPARISAFLTDGQYQAAVEDLRVSIARAISVGGPVVKDAGKAALDSGSIDAYRAFLATGWTRPATRTNACAPPS
jgi:hypothetical protein